MFKLLFLPFRLVRLGIRIAGVKGFLLLVLGVAIGLLIAPTPGAELRDRIMDKLEERRRATDPGRVPEGM